MKFAVTQAQLDRMRMSMLQDALGDWHAGDFLRRLRTHLDCIRNASGVSGSVVEFVVLPPDVPDTATDYDLRKCI